MQISSSGDTAATEGTHTTSGSSASEGECYGSPSQPPCEAIHVGRVRRQVERFTTWRLDATNVVMGRDSARADPCACTARRRWSDRASCRVQQHKLASCIGSLRGNLLLEIALVRRVRSVADEKHDVRLLHT